MAYRLAGALAAAALLTSATTVGAPAVEAGPSPAIVTHRLDPEQMQEDLARLHFAILHAHAAPYRYVSRPDLDRRFEAISRRLHHAMTDLDFYRLLAPLIAAISNSHTSIQPPEDALRSMRADGSAFPLVLRYRDERAIVERNLSDDAGIERGMEVLALDDRPMAEVTQELMSMRPSEGHVLTAKYARLDQSFWLDLMLRFGSSKTYSVVVRDPSSGAETKHRVTGVPAQKLTAAVRQFPAEGGPALSLAIQQEFGTAVMRLRTFLEPETPAFLAKAFHDMATSRTSSLIIDLRGNHGGIDWFNSELLSYISDGPFRFYRSREYVARSYDDLKYLTYDLSDFLLPDQIAALPAAVRQDPFRQWTLPQLIDFSLATDHAGGVQSPRTRDHFAGRVYVLVDGMSGSSSAEVPALMHHLGLATIIGEEPNGSYQGEVAGIIPILKLPNSKLTVHIPLVAYQNEVLPTVRIGRGVEPTFEVAETVEDAATGVDTAMEFTKALIRGRGRAHPASADAAPDRM